jgi:hypothetical protein
MFLEANGVRSLALTDEKLYDAMIDIAEKRIDRIGLATVFRSRCS